MDIFKEYRKERSIIEFKTSKVLLCLLFIISPLISLPFILIEIYNKKSYALILLALFMGFIAILFPPVYDLYRHHINFYGLDITKENLNEEIFVRPDFILPYLNIIIKNIGLQFEIIRFILVTTSYLIIFWIFRDVIHSKPELKKYYFRIFIILFCSAHFFLLTTGLRYMEATYLFILGIYLITFKKNKIGYLPFIISACLHFSFLAYIIIFFILLRFNARLNNKKIIVTSILCLIIINPTFIDFFITILPLSRGLKILIRAYCIGIFGNLEDRSIIYIIAYTIEIMLIFPLILIILKLNNKKLINNSRIINLERFNIIILAFLYGISFLFFYRFSLIFISLGLLIYFYNFKMLSLKWLNILIFCSCIMFVSDIYKYRREFFISQEYRLIQPIPLILSADYDNYWVEEVINDDGYLKTNPK